MRTDRELLRDALNYLMLPGAYVYIDGVKALREEIRARLADPDDESVRLHDEEILAIAEKYGTSSTRHKPTYHLHDGSPTGETYPQTDWDFGQEDLLAFARELLEKNQCKS